MSIKNYLEAVETIEKNKIKCFFVGERTDEIIELAEKKLGLTFPYTYRSFLKKYGAGNIGSSEILGVIDSDFENSSVPDGIWYTMSIRNRASLPLNLLAIHDTGSEEIFCLDFNRLSIEQEPSIVVFVPGVDLEFQKYEVIASDFGEFLLDLAMSIVEC